MAMTFLSVHKDGGEGNSLRLLISNEYLPHKERDAEGKVLPNQEWQHPDPTTLRYTEIGELKAPERVTRLLQTMVDHSVEFSGGHLRIIRENAAEIAEGRLQTWEERQAAEDALRKEMEAKRQLEHEIEEQKRAPVYEWCARCGTEREACKNAAHRGNKCMHCCGGVGDIENRYCTNCLDLPYREKREKALGAPIIYTGESDDD